MFVLFCLENNRPVRLACDLLIDKATKIMTTLCGIVCVVENNCTCLFFALYTSVPSLRQRQSVEDDVLIWDKDCSLDLDFVASAANLRASVFGISLKSKFTIKCEFVT